MAYPTPEPSVAPSSRRAPFDVPWRGLGSQVQLESPHDLPPPAVPDQIPPIVLTPQSASQLASANGLSVSPCSQSPARRTSPSSSACGRDTASPPPSPPRRSQSSSKLSSLSASPKSVSPERPSSPPCGNGGPQPPDPKPKKDPKPKDPQSKKSSKSQSKKGRIRGKDKGDDGGDGSNKGGDREPDTKSVPVEVELLTSEQLEDVFQDLNLPANGKPTRKVTANGVPFSPSESDQPSPEHLRRRVRSENPFLLWDIDGITEEYYPAVPVRTPLNITNGV